MRVLVAVLVLTLAACDSGDTVVPVAPYFEAQIDGADWRADTAATSQNVTAFVLWGRKNRVQDGFFCRPDPCEELAFDVRPPPDGARTYPMAGLNRAYFTVADGDEVLRAYTSLDGYGSLTVTPTPDGGTTGTFSLDLLNDADDQDTLRVRSGRFRVPSGSDG